MPQYKFVQLDTNTAYLLWHINESIEELLTMLPLSPHDQKIYHIISHPYKKKEWLASRLALKILLTHLGYAKSALYKDALGKPCLISQEGHISIAHCKEFALVAFSQEAPIGIDIEKVENQVQIVQHKFLNQLEIHDVKNDLYKCGIYWCAKESIYKLYGGKLSMKKDIHITPFHLATHGTIMITVTTTFLQAHYTSFLHQNIPYVIIWCKQSVEL